VKLLEKVPEFLVQVGVENEERRDLRKSSVRRFITIFITIFITTIIINTTINTTTTTIIITFTRFSAGGAGLPCSTDTTCWKREVSSPRLLPSRRRNRRLRSNNRCSVS